MTVEGRSEGHVRFKRERRQMLTPVSPSSGRERAETGESETGLYSGL